MSKKIAIIGAGGFGREVKWLIERINIEYAKKTGEPAWKIEGFIDDGSVESHMDEIPVLGNTELLKQWDEPISAVCAIGNAETRKRVIEKIKANQNIDFPNLVDPSVIMSGKVVMGEGNIICAGNILTVNIEIGDFVIINLDCTVGHDTQINSYVTIYPSVNISGYVKIGLCTEVGTGSHIIQNKEISMHSIIGAGAVVVKDIPEYCVSVGNPAKVIKSRVLV